MNEGVEARARRAPFLWISSAAFRKLTQDLAPRQRANVGWVYACLASAASDANDGDHEGFSTSPSQVQALTGLSRSTFKTAIQTLEEVGLLYRQIRHDERGMTIGVRYVLLEPSQRGAAEQPHEGMGSGANGSPTNAREPTQRITKNTPLTPLERENQIRKGLKTLSYGHSQASKQQTALALALFDAYNSEVGRAVKLIMGTGRVNSDATMILGAVMDHPDVMEPTWRRMMHTVLANPWWSGKPSVNVVFSPKVVDDNLADPARGRGGQGSNSMPVIRRRREELDLG